MNKITHLPKLPGENINFIVTSELILPLREDLMSNLNINVHNMGHFVEQNRMDFMLVAGDLVHETDWIDEKWYMKIEEVYAAPSLNAFPWYIVFGNHEYYGGVQKVFDYININKRWKAQSERYYAFTQKLNTDNECLFVIIDTTPFVDFFCNEKYTDAGKQDKKTQLEWIENTLSVSSARWKIVVGHHHVYAKTRKRQSEMINMQENIGVLLEKYNVDAYICGHVRSFQHLKPTGSKVHYIVNAPMPYAFIPRENDVEGVLFTCPNPGFSVFTMSNDSLRFFFVNHRNEMIYDQTIRK